MIKENAEWYNATICCGQEEIQRTKSNGTHFICQTVESLCMVLCKWFPQKCSEGAAIAMP